MSLKGRDNEIGHGEVGSIASEDLHPQGLLQVASGVGKDEGEGIADLDQDLYEFQKNPCFTIRGTEHGSPHSFTPCLLNKLGI